jgi:hypothetical protein
MEISDAASNLSLLTFYLKTYWIVPAGLLALYFYGRAHFNTPDYALELVDEHGQPVSQWGRMISTAPPIFTTSRLRYNRYAWRYILLLQGAFFAFLFYPELIVNIGKILNQQINLPQSEEGLLYRGLFALFALTGLLSSLPLLKDVDAWLRKKFHRAAYIPDDARLLAEQLRDADVVASDADAALAAANDLGKRRDVAKVARGAAFGALEALLLNAFWLKAELARLALDRRHLEVRRTLERDLNEIAAILHDLKPDLDAYFDAQESLLPADVGDIDEYIRSHLAEPGFSKLLEQRRTITKQVSALYNRMCLIMSLFVYGTKATPLEMESALRKAGFQISVTATPAWDWVAVGRVVACIFLALLITESALIAFISMVGIESPWISFFTRGQLLVDAAVDTLVIGAVVLTAIRLKRHWWFREQRSPRSENLMVGIASFAVASIYYVAVQYAMQQYVDYKPLMTAVAPGIAGYFVAIFIDRSMNGLPRSWGLTFMLAGYLALGAALGVYFAGDQFGVVEVSLVAIAGGVVGLVLGALFPYWYQRTEFSPQHEPEGQVKVLADLAWRPKLVAQGQQLNG